MQKCLIVDDVQVTLFSTKKALTSLGVESFGVSTSEEALNSLRKETYDLVFLDWHLGKKSGIDVLKTIRTEHGKKPHVVMCSGVEGSNKASEALAAGADAFLEKPTTPEKVKKCLQDLGLL